MQVIIFANVDKGDVEEEGNLGREGGCPEGRREEEQISI